MKKIIFALLLMLPFFANALEKIELIREYPDRSKDKIFNAAKQWIATNFKSANDVIQYADLDSGTIISKGNMEMPCKGFIRCPGDVYLNFTLKIDTKDGKARIAFDDYYVSYLKNPYISPARKLDLSNKQTDESRPVITNLANQIANALNEKVDIKANDGW